jgi:hypothetical protein
MEFTVYPLERRSSWTLFLKSVADEKGWASVGIFLEWHSSRGFIVWFREEWERLADLKDKPRAMPRACQGASPLLNLQPKSKQNRDASRNPK